MKSILLLVPCYNEESRLHFGDFEQGRAACLEKGITLSFLFANDGSTDKTHKILDDYCAGKENYHCYHLPQNAGKGNALQEAYTQMKSSLKYDSFDWIGYWDADLATPFAEIPKMITYLSYYNENEVHSIWGSRISRLGSRIKRQVHRHYLGRIFVTIVGFLLKVKAYDSQCGAKLFRPKAAADAFAEPFLSRWIFDVEILLRLKEQNIVEFPLFQWEDIPGSKVKIFREMGRVGKDILRIRKKYKTY